MVFSEDEQRLMDALNQQMEQRKQAYFTQTEAIRTALEEIVSSKKTSVRDKIRASELLMEIIRRG